MVKFKKEVSIKISTSFYFIFICFKTQRNTNGLYIYMILRNTTWEKFGTFILIGFACHQHFRISRDFSKNITSARFRKVKSLETSRLFTNGGNSRLSEI